MRTEATPPESQSPTAAASHTANAPTAGPAGAGASPPSSLNTPANRAAPADSATPSVRIDGLSETLAEARHELHLISHAGKYEWLNKRLILLRNAVIAFSVLIAAVVVTVMCYREAYRETLSIAPFSVPERLAERGITGPVLAQHLFDELITRRKTVTTLDAGDLKGTWLEHESDVAVPEAGFTFQSLFRYLRSLTGKEVSVRGEMLVDGEDITIDARVQGYPPHAVKGKLGEWESLLGELANYVYGTTQPVVLASYLSQTAKTPDDLKAVSVLVTKMSETRAPTEMAAVYYGYGKALEKLGRPDDALIAYERSIALDNKSALSYVAAGSLQWALGHFDQADTLMAAADKLPLSREARFESGKVQSISALNDFDCRRAAPPLERLSRLGADPLWLDLAHAGYLSRCEYRIAEAAAIVDRVLVLHPAHAVAWVNSANFEANRDNWKAAAEKFRRAVELAPANIIFRGNLSRAYAEDGQFDDALREHAELVGRYGAGNFVSLRALGRIRQKQGQYKEAETALRASIAARSTSGLTHIWLAQTLAASGRIDDAMEELQKVKAINPLFCNAYYEGAKIWLDAAKPDQAFKELDQANRLIPKCDKPYLIYAKELIAQKRTAEARAKLELLIKNSPGSDGAAEAKRMLAASAKPI